MATTIFRSQNGVPKQQIVSSFVSCKIVF